MYMNKKLRASNYVLKMDKWHEPTTTEEWSVYGDKLVTMQL